MLNDQQGVIQLVFSTYFVVSATIQGQPQDLQVKPANFYYRDGLTGLNRKFEPTMVNQRVQFNCAKFIKPIWLASMQVRFYVTNAWEEGGRAPPDDEEKVKELIQESKKSQAAARMSETTPPSSLIRPIASQSPLLRKISSPSLSSSPLAFSSLCGPHIGDVASTSPSSNIVGARDSATPLLNSRGLLEVSISHLVHTCVSLNPHELRCQLIFPLSPASLV